MKELNCPNCGAPITGFKCEYCGTQFFDFANMELYKWGHLRIKINGNILTIKALPYNVTLEMNRDELPRLKLEFVIEGLEQTNAKGDKYGYRKPY